MQQGMKMPKKEGETTLSQQVVNDLKAANINLPNDLKTVAEQMAIFRNPEAVAAIAAEEGSSPDKVRAEIVGDIITIIGKDLEAIGNARATEAISKKEENPEYKKAMDNIVEGLRDGLKDLVNAQFEFGSVASTKTEFQKEHKKA